jgi:hypothetical protein
MHSLCYGFISLIFELCDPRYLILISRTETATEILSDSTSAHDSLGRLSVCGPLRQCMRDLVSNYSTVSYLSVNLSIELRGRLGSRVTDRSYTNRGQDYLYRYGPSLEMLLEDNCRTHRVEEFRHHHFETQHILMIFRWISAPMWWDQIDDSISCTTMGVRSRAKSSHLHSPNQRFSTTRRWQGHLEWIRDQNVLGGEISRVRSEPDPGAMAVSSISSGLQYTWPQSLDPAGIDDLGDASYGSSSTKEKYRYRSSSVQDNEADGCRIHDPDSAVICA